MKRLLAFLFVLLIYTAAYADSTINNLSAGTTLGGTEQIPMYQGSNPATTTTPAAIKTYVGAMTTSGSNAASAALDAIATAAGQTGGLKQTDSPTFGTVTTPGSLTAGTVNSTTSTLNGNLNINQANIFDVINVSSAVTNAYANPMNLLVPSLGTGYNIAFRVGTANSTDNAAQLIFNDNGGAGSSTNSVQMSLYAGVGGVTLTGTGALSLGGGSTANVTLASTGYDSCVGLTTSVAGVIGCTGSAKRLKNPLGNYDGSRAEANIDALTPATWTYKDPDSYGAGEHIGLYADDVCKLDERACVRKKDGTIQNYDERAVIAWLVAAHKSDRAEIEKLKASRRR